MKKIILVTGCSKGLGRAVVESLTQKDWIVYAGIRNLQSSSDLIKEWGRNYKNIKPIKLDITKNSDAKEAVSRIIKKEGRVDVLLNIAGYSLAGATVDFEIDEFRKILETNVVGAFRLTKAVTPQMKKQGGGRIINLTSLNGYVALPNFGIYSASKFALEALGRATRYELLGDNIWVTNIAPGAILSASEKTVKKLPHKPAREKFKILKVLLPMATQKEVISKIKKVIRMSSPPAQVLIGADVKITVFLQRLLPNVLWDRLVRFVWSKK